ncbi:uroporphyrinogen-III synthase [Canibacter zhoujuaniae]|uniref:uroporphyrinogen-III synthase n=1 Tax=Canibacter zhoujuaniae TaxID=2708343 RepID=UPI00142242E8|nr:uroporphyrinogen-III synthase [Canibacter zhoujuaniae]
MANQGAQLTGQRVLVPRGGAWGKVVAKALRAQGATPVVAPLIDFAHTSEVDRLREALVKLEAGYYDWMTATNATVVDVLDYNHIKIAKRTQVAVAGEATYAAFIDAGYEVARTTHESDTTTVGLLKVWPEINSGDVLRVLTLRSDVAKPVLTMGLLERGHDVTQVVAYRTVGVPASVHIREDVAAGEITAILVSSPQVAREVATQFGSRTDSTVIACIGEHTVDEARRLGLASGDKAPADIEERIVETVLGALDPADMLD